MFLEVQTNQGTLLSYMFFLLISDQTTEILHVHCQGKLDLETTSSLKPLCSGLSYNTFLFGHVCHLNVSDRNRS